MIDNIDHTPCGEFYASKNAINVNQLQIYTLPTVKGNAGICETAAAIIVNNIININDNNAIN